MKASKKSEILWEPSAKTIHIVESKLNRIIQVSYYIRLNMVISNIIKYNLKEDQLSAPF